MVKYAKIMLLFLCVLSAAAGLSGCGGKQSAVLNNRMKDKASAADADNEAGITAVPSASATENITQTEEIEDPEYQEFMASVSEAASPAPDTKSSSDGKDFGEADTTGRVGYHCDIVKDKKNYNGKPDIVVGDKFYATQINDWYANFDQYEGKTVEIEGYYIDDYEPYTFVGRYGPSCPYCNGGYVSFEFYTQEDLSALKSGEDWIKAAGILRKGEDSSGIFYYIEILSLEKMDKVGKDTVTD